MLVAPDTLIEIHLNLKPILKLMTNQKANHER
jgi:hypothetical protein